MNSANFLQVMPGGHCLICHGDYQDHDAHGCWQKAMVGTAGTSECTPECYAEGRFMRRSAGGRDAYGRGYEQGKSDARTEIELRLGRNIRMLRQWLNEDRIGNPENMVCDGDLRVWLELP